LKHGSCAVFGPRSLDLGIDLLCSGDTIELLQVINDRFA
jgi:hypothetical protein